MDGGSLDMGDLIDSVTNESHFCSKPIVKILIIDIFVKGEIHEHYTDLDSQIV